MGLRYYLERMVTGVFFSASEIELRTWLNGSRDTYWTEVANTDDKDIFSRKFCNAFFPELVEQVNYTKPFTIIDDMTETNDTRLGAVCDLLFAMDNLQIDDDMLVVAAGNLLFFSFADFVKFAKEKNASCIMRHYQPFLAMQSQPSWRSC